MRVSILPTEMTPNMTVKGSCAKSRAAPYLYVRQFHGMQLDKRRFINTMYL